MNLPSSFTHEPPNENFTYEVTEFNRNYLAIWLVNHSSFTYNDGIPVKTIWGFYNTKKGEYHAPINFKKCGEVVSFDDTRDYTAMQLNLNPLQAAFM